MAKKLTLVSVTFRGKTYSRFVVAPRYQGRVIVSPKVIDSLLEEAGAHRGDTYSF